MSLLRRVFGFDLRERMDDMEQRVASLETAFRRVGETIDGQ